jgi:hypothetical protein
MSKHAKASNHALEPTASRAAFTFPMIKPLSVYLTLGVGSRSSYCSR